jgi:predicted membrane protein
MNKEQIRHWSVVLGEIATGQFLFCGGRNIYVHSQLGVLDWPLLILSAVVYFVIHGIIHQVLLRRVEE